jgi:TonB family protein
MEKYFLIATISSIAFYAIYHFFLRKESFHQFNRFYLLSAMIISLGIPFIQIPVIGAVNPTSNVPTSNVVEFITYIQLPEFTVYEQNAPIRNMANLLLGIYFAGVIVFTLLFFVKIIKISLLIIKSKRKRVGKYIYVEYEANMAPFSFFNYIFINSNAYNQEDNERIILHEQIHVRQRHSWDLIFTELVSIVLWFNPVMLIYKRSLQVIHEYMADHRVLQQGIETGAYLNLLLRQLTLPGEWMLGHHFNYLLTKNRFKMLKNNHYSKWALAKIALVLPFIALLLMLNCKHKSQEPEPETYTLELPASDIGEEETTYDVEITGEGTNDQHVKIEKAKKQDVKPDAKGNYRFVEVMPEYPGGMDAMYKFLTENLKYPEKARNDTISGQVFVEFVVRKDGTIGNVKLLAGVHPDLDAEAIRVVKLLPKWKPGMIKGEHVPCYYQIPIRFTIK